MGDIIKPHNVVLFFQTFSSSLTDGLVGYLGSQNFFTATQGAYPLKCPVAGVLEKVDLTLNQTDGTNEGVTIEVLVNNVSVGTLLNNAPLLNNAYMRTWPDVNVEIDDVLEIKITCPVWVTNPTSTRVGGHYLIRV